jgi:hypothetical protein
MLRADSLIANVVVEAHSRVVKLAMGCAPTAPAPALRRRSRLCKMRASDTG